MHLSPIRLVAAAAGAGLGALGALAVGPLLGAGAGAAVGAATSGPSAQAEYSAAIRAVGTKGVHFESTALQSGVSLTVIGDTGTTSGAQQLTVKKSGTTEHMAAVVVGSTGYIKGNAAALHNVIGLTSAQSSKYANTWLSFPTSNSSLAELVSGLLNSQVASELQMSGPFTYGTATTVHGQRARWWCAATSATRAAARCRPCSTCPPRDPRCPSRRSPTRPPAPSPRSFTGR